MAAGMPSLFWVVRGRDTKHSASGMGVPGFFKWITIKYPKVLIDCIEERVVEMAGTRIPLKLTDPNPNGEEFDCLYVDMNGLVHPCCHPEGRPPPATEHV